MKRTFSSGLIEPLEARIAPATIYIGAISADGQSQPENAKDTEYREDVTAGPRPEEFGRISFVDTSSSTDLISQAVDSALSDNTFYLRLKTGDTVERYTDRSGYQTYIQVKSGNVIAFFTDLNNNNEFDDGELTGLSLGANAVVEINGGVNGDILSNLDEHRTRDLADDTINLTGLGATGQGIGSLKVLGGSVRGSILSGGAIKSLVVAQNVESVQAGTAVYNTNFDVFKVADPGNPDGFLAERYTQIDPGANGVISKAPGASITNVVVGSVTDRIEAGAGAAGAKGGSLIGIQVLADSNGFELIAGNGGGGDGISKRLFGGAGGDLQNIYVSGAIDNTANSAGGIVIKAGNGGAGISAAKGGVGGKATNIQVGYDLVTGGAIASADLVADSVSIQAGDGGSGKLGGLGGSLSQIKVRVLTPDGNGNEIEVIAGDGGANTSPGGRAGVGGSVSNVDLRNQISTAGGDLLIQAGTGGDSNAASLGATGGSVQNALLVGFDSQIFAGDGSDGKTGGLGGTISGVTILRDDTIVARNVLLNAGHGGVGFASRGGAGGEVRNISADNGDYQSFLINIGVAGNGGEGLNGLGGKGGGVSHVDIGDFDSNLGLGVSLEGNVDIRSGIGGDGTRGGGAGGSLADIDLRGGNNLNIKAVAGTGGSATVAGKGGVGGALDLVQLTSDGTVAGADVTGILQSGSGGDGKGKNGAGGSGGDIRTTSLSIAGDGSVIAGDGGNGQIAASGVAGAAAGRGGSIIATGLFGRLGSATLQAGDAGVNGAKAAAGGSIVGSGETLSGLRGSQNITVEAGDGSHGGAGGDIVGLTYGSTSETLTPTPTGKILIQSGSGSSEGKVAGRGGNIVNVSGSVSSGVNQVTQFTAGDGGGSNTVTKAAPGGSISDVVVSRGGSVGGVLFFEAGDAGDSPAAAKGAAGGSVSRIGVSELVAGTLFRSVAAGDGGDAARIAGAGGSITSVDAQSQDIGVRTGQAYGYTTMGGLFAGVSGTAAKAGLNGSVTNVTADAISSIVAGRNDVPRLAEKVGDIYVTGDASTLLLTTNDALVPNGDFQLRFGSQQTVVIAKNSSAATVQAALNSLSGIQAAGNVSVTLTQSRGYQITFLKAGNQPLISGVEIVPGDVTEEIRGKVETIPVSVEVDGSVVLPVVEVRPGQFTLNVIESTPGAAGFVTNEQQPGTDTTSEVQILDLTALAQFQDGQFRLTFEGATTGLLAATATAQEIETALEALATIDPATGVTVSVLDANRFTITFGALGAQPTIEGERLIHETQRVNLDSLTGFANGSFALTFGANTTGQLPGTATAADIAAALNALPSIQAAGNVVVTQAGAGQFDVTFGANGDQAELVGNATVPELQELSLTALAAIPGTTFTISSGNETTPQLPATASAAQIEAALNNLPSIQAQGGVTVTISPTGVVDITFKLAGQKINLTSVGLRAESQAIDLGGTKGATTDYTLSLQHTLSLVEATKGTVTLLEGIDTFTPPFTLINLPAVVSVDGTPQTKEVQTLNVALVTQNATQQYVLNFNGQNTAPIKTAGLTPAQTAAAIANALNALGTVTTVGGVTVASAGGTNYAITFVQNGDVNPITGKGYVRVTQPGGFLASDVAVDGFDVVTVVGGTPTTAEVDRLDVNKIVVLGGSFVLNFAGETTGVIPIPGSINSLRQDIEESLNALVSIGGVGGVVVTEPVPGSNIFTITFSAVGNEPELTATGFVPETQRLNLSSLGADPTSEYTLEFDGQVTTTLPGNADAVAVQTALNALGTIIAQGGVVVTGSAAAGFKIEFNRVGTNGDQSPIIANTGGEASHEHQLLDLGSLSAYTSGLFQLTFGGQKTEPLPVNATADQIAAALNALPAIEQIRTDLNGEVQVTAIAPGKFDIEFNIFGDQALATANGTVTTDRYPVQVTQVQNGLQLPVVVSEVQSGSSSQAPSFELIKGNTTTREVQRVDLTALAASPQGQFSIALGGLSTVSLPFGATAAQVADALNALTTVQNAGGVTVTTAPNSGYDITFNVAGDRATVDALVTLKEIQAIDATAITSTAGGEFVLKFGSFVTAPLAATATAADVQAALNSLNAVKNAGGVTVTSSAPGKFAVTFGNFGDLATISGVGGGTATHELQTITLGELRTVAGGQFNLTYNGKTTAPIASGASATEIQAALNALETVKNIRSDRSGAVTVTESAPGTFSVSFNSFGDLSTITGRSLVTSDRILNSVEVVAGASNIVLPVTEKIQGSAAVKEVQTISRANLVDPNGKFQLRFDTQVNGGSVASTTNILPANASADIQAALNGIASIVAAGGVTVTSGADNSVDVTFNNPGNRDSIIGMGGVAEQQSVQLGELANNPNGVFRLVVNGESTQALRVGATAAEVDAALDALASIKALRSGNGGSVNVQAGAGGTPSSYTIDFNDLGNQAAVSGIATVAVEPALDIRELTSGGNSPLGVSETLHGQTILVSTAETTPGTAEGKEVQSVDLSNLIGVSNGVFQLAYGANKTGFLSRYAQASEIESALNALPSIPAGGVTVAAGANNTFNITFNETGDKAAITAVAGVQEVQHLDTSLVKGGTGTFTVSFGDVTSNPIPATASAADVATILNGMSSVAAAGGVTVSQSSSGFDIRFNTPGDQAAFGGSVTLFEQQLLDIHHFASVENGQLRFTFGSDTTAPIDADATAQQIQDALNALPGIKALNATNTGSVIVVDVAPGVFRIDFSVAGNQPLIGGTRNSFGTTDRLPGSATVAELNAALDGVSFVNIDVTPGSTANVVVAKFSESADQPLITGRSYTHENQRVDIYAVGEFVLSYGGDTTVRFAANASEIEIRDALNALPSIIALGGIGEVTRGDNSSFSFTFNGDNDPVVIEATQFLNPVPVTTTRDGTATIREIQQVDFTNKGAFVPDKFVASSLVGAIRDFNEIDSNTFHFVELNNLPGFNEGDLPIDGIVMAKILDQATINFIPEAKLTANGFFDSNNRI
ncbi:MAG: hypothetical protein V4710_08310 [Verrucomicrobiota bacterium]